VNSTATEASPLRVLAYPLMPADPGRRGEVVEAPQDWSLDAADLDPEAGTVAWGRAADRSPLLRSAVRHAVAREAALLAIRRRVPPPLRLVAVHRLPPRQLESHGLRGGVPAAIRSGALVELSSLPSAARIVDRVLADANVGRSESGFHAGAGGSMLIRVALSDGAEALLRVARAGAPGDPASSADVLERLSGAGVPLAPRVHVRGQTAGASWVVERALPGRRPRRATEELARQVAAVCAGFPRGDGAPTATAADFSGIADRLPDRTGALDRLATEVAGQVGSLPSVLRHGDLWAGNLLVERGRLSGLIDWDAAHPAAVPGADMLQLVATELRRRARRGLGLMFLSSPWRSPMFSQATRGYWAELGLRPDDTLLDVVGIAWWATEVHGTLARLPHRAADERWVTKNVDRVLNALGY
jgi:aminoglycoside phosphotransferase